MPIKKAAPAPAAAKGGMKKMAIVEDDDSEDEEDVPIKKAAPAPAAAKSGMKKMAIVEDDDDDESEAPLTAAEAAALAKADAIRLAGNELFKGGQYEDAMAKYSEALGTVEGTKAAEVELSAKCLNNRAACACQLQRYKAAVDDCTKVLARSPKEAKALMRRGFANEALERYEAALADMRAVQRIEPSAQAGAACVRLEKFKQQSAKLAAQDAAAAQSNPKAKAAAEKAKADKAAAEAKADKAAAEAKQAAEAKAAAEKTKRAEVEKKVAEAKAAEAAKAAKATEAAQAAKAAKSAPTPPPPAPASGDAEAAAKALAAKERGTAALKKGEYRQAAEAYREATILAPTDHTHFSNLSLALLKYGQPQHAATAARRCTELAPSFVKGHFRLGQALRQDGQPAEAAESLRAALELSQKGGGKDAEIARELSAAQREAADSKAWLKKGGGAASKPAAAAKPAAKPASISIVHDDADDAVEEISTSPTRGKPGTCKVLKPAKDISEMQRKAAEVAKRAAELKGSSSPTSAAKTSLSAFEREFHVLWRHGKAAASAPADGLRALLGQLPSSAAEMSGFVGEGLSDELLSGLILATAKAGEPAAEAAARLCALTATRRFDMCSMFLGKAEKAAVRDVLQEAKNSGELDQYEVLTSAAKKYGVQI